jgi:hypothetical protein
MEIILDAQDFETKIHLNQLQRTIEYAHLRCLSTIEIINKISDIDEKQDRSSCVTRLLELKLDESELILVERTMTKLAERSQEAPSTLRKKLDRVVPGLRGCYLPNSQLILPAPTWIIAVKLDESGLIQPFAIRRFPEVWRRS